MLSCRCKSISFLFWTHCFISTETPPLTNTCRSDGCAFSQLLRSWVGFSAVESLEISHIRCGEWVSPFISVLKIAAPPLKKIDSLNFLVTYFWLFIGDNDDGGALRHNQPQTSRLNVRKKKIEQQIFYLSLFKVESSVNWNYSGLSWDDTDRHS